MGEVNMGMKSKKWFEDVGMSRDAQDGAVLVAGVLMITLGFIGLFGWWVVPVIVGLLMIATVI
jgi:hypothetical protein